MRILLLLLLITGCGANANIKDAAVLEGAMASEIEITPFCAATITPIEDEAYDIGVYCADGYSFKDSKAYGELEQMIDLEPLIEDGFIILRKEQMQKLATDLVRIGVSL